MFVAFAPVFAAIVVLGLFAAWQLSTVDAAIEGLKTRGLATAMLLGRLEGNMERTRSFQAQAMLSADGQRGYIERSADAEAQLEKQIAQLMSAAATAEERQLITIFDQTHKAMWRKHLEWQTAIESGDRSGALALYSSAVPLGAARRTTLNDEIVFVSKETATAADEAIRAGHVATVWIVAGISAVGAMCLASGVMLVRTVCRPIGSLTQAMDRLAGRDLSVEIVHAGRRDEIGAMARTMAVFKASLGDGERLAEEREASRARGEARARKLRDLTQRFEGRAGEMVTVVTAAVGTLHGTAETMSGTAKATGSQAVAVAAAADRANANVQAVAVATEQLAASIREIGRQVARSARVAGKAAEDARRTDAVVQALASGAQRIGDVVGLINSISGQTNLLALNATIEAARAGDSGRGFAVVASEVKSLANQTGKATEDIAAQIGQIQSATREAVLAIQGIAATIAEVSEIAAAIAASVHEQGSATAEISRNVHDAATGTSAVSSHIAGLSKGALDSDTTAAQVLHAANDLSRQADVLSGEVTRFVADVRAV
jgi:methyl-accepting chemotaxis protein